MRKAMLVVLVVAVALSLAAVGAAWTLGNSGNSTEQQAGWTWDEGVSSYVWADI